MISREISNPESDILHPVYLDGSNNPLLDDLTGLPKRRTRAFLATENWIPSRVMRIECSPGRDFSLECDEPEELSDPTLLKDVFSMQDSSEQWTLTVRVKSFLACMPRFRDKLNETMLRNSTEIAPVFNRPNTIINTKDRDTHDIICSKFWKLFSTHDEPSFDANNLLEDFPDVDDLIDVLVYHASAETLIEIFTRDSTMEDMFVPQIQFCHWLGLERDFELSCETDTDSEASSECITVIVATNSDQGQQAEMKETAGTCSSSSLTISASGHNDEDDRDYRNRTSVAEVLQRCYGEDPAVTVKWLECKGTESWLSIDGDTTDKRNNDELPVCRINEYASCRQCNARMHRLGVVKEIYAAEKMISAMMKISKSVTGPEFRKIAISVEKSVCHAVGQCIGSMTGHLDTWWQYRRLVNCIGHHDDSQRGKRKRVDDETNEVPLQLSRKILKAYKSATIELSATHDFMSCDEVRSRLASLRPAYCHGFNFYVYERHENKRVLYFNDDKMRYKDELFKNGRSESMRFYEEDYKFEMEDEMVSHKIFADVFGDIPRVFGADKREERLERGRWGVDIDTSLSYILFESKGMSKYIYQTMSMRYPRIKDSSNAGCDAKSNKIVDSVDVVAGR